MIKKKLRAIETENPHSLRTAST